MQPIVEAAVNGIPLIIPVIGLVVYIKQLGLRGEALLLVSMAIGLALGAGYQLAVLPAPPTTFGEWFAIVIFGICVGLVASGVYDVGQGLVAPILSALKAAGLGTAAKRAVEPGAMPFDPPPAYTTGDTFLRNPPPVPSSADVARQQARLGQDLADLGADDPGRG